MHDQPLWAWFLKGFGLALLCGATAVVIITTVMGCMVGWRVLLR